MKSPKAFIAAYIRERNAIARQDLKQVAELCRKFYTNDCPLRRRLQKLQDSMGTTEEIVAAVTLAGSAQVTTVTRDKAGNSLHLRYGLEAVNKRWLIRHVDIECLSCKGRAGDWNCEICKGDGWRRLQRKQDTRVDSLSGPDVPPLPPFRRF